MMAVAVAVVGFVDSDIDRPFLLTGLALSPVTGDDAVIGDDELLVLPFNENDSILPWE